METCLSRKFFEVRQTREYVSKNIRYNKIPHNKTLSLHGINKPYKKVSCYISDLMFIKWSVKQRYSYYFTFSIPISCAYLCKYLSLLLIMSTLHVSQNLNFTLRYFSSIKKQKYLFYKITYKNYSHSKIYLPCCCLTLLKDRLK